MTPAATSPSSVKRLQPRGRGIDFVERLAGELWRDCSCGVTAGGSGVRIIVTDQDGGDGRSVNGPGVPLLTKTESLRPAKDRLVSPVRGCESGLRSDGDDALVGSPIAECGRNALGGARRGCLPPHEMARRTVVRMTMTLYARLRIGAFMEQPSCPRRARARVTSTAVSGSAFQKQRPRSMIWPPKHPVISELVCLGDE
jgi:hypothetical protein